MNDNSSNILLKQLNDIGILRLILNDPNNKNALSDIMMQELIDSLNKADLDNSVKVIVIGSVGDVFYSNTILKKLMKLEIIMMKENIILLIYLINVHI